MNSFFLITANHSNIQMRKNLLSAFLLAFILVSNVDAQNTRVKKVLLQGFWWDYWNSNFPNAWSNYLTEIAPRLKALGIDAVWVPAAYKNSGTGSVGYAPFDHYDLGDKFQKGSLRTRMGTKDELLRMVAVMHSNGIEVIEDVVLNHVNSAGSNLGSGGQDPEPLYSMRNESGYKNFRYVSFATPAVNESQTDYWTRNGRWPKNYTNFYPNRNNNCTTGEICTNYFGPDVSFESNAIGQSSNIPRSGSVSVGGITRAYVNPVQAANYMRDGANNWLLWLKKQTGFDGWRMDAVKHFPISIQTHIIYNTKYTGPAFVQGGESMLSIGEWIGNKTDLDNYVTAVRSGTEEHTGAFDFSLRGYGPNGGLYSMVASQGNYNVQHLPSEQQLKRFFNYPSQRVHRTLPFVNNHDTFRPFLAANGNYAKPLGDASGWNSGSELGGNGAHIDPRDPRLFAAYATIFAMDGNPTVFFEDLFDIGTTGKRFSHLPFDINDLPVREDVLNLIRVHQKLAFKDGDYAVPTALTGTQAPYYAKGSSANHIVFERIGKAIIGVTDRLSAVANNADDEEVWVSVGDLSWANKDLIDYSGAHGLSTTRVYPDGRVLIKTAPAGHTIGNARGHGYSIWAPIPSGVTFNSVEDIYTYLYAYYPSRNSYTTQEWEMADDLGDSHANSLQQGGRLPNNSTAQRTAGRIYAAAGQQLIYRLYPELNGRSQVVALYNGNGNVVSQVSGTSSNTAPLVGYYTPATDGWITLKASNTNNTTPGQRVWINVTYTAPTVVNTRTAPGNLRTSDDQSMLPLLPEARVHLFPNPTQDQVYFSFNDLDLLAKVQVVVVDLRGQKVFELTTNTTDVEQAFNQYFSMLKAGIYFIRLEWNQQHEQLKLIKLQ